MSILSGINEINLAANAVRGIFGALKPKPKASAASPAASLHSPSSKKATADFLAELRKATSRYMELRDANRDGALDAVEFGLGQDLFSRIDRDGNGLLTPSELSKAAAANPGLLSPGGAAGKA